MFSDVMQSNWEHSAFKASDVNNEHQCRNIRIYSGGVTFCNFLYWLLRKKYYRIHGRIKILAVQKEAKGMSGPKKIVSYSLGHSSYLAGIPSNMKNKIMQYAIAFSVLSLCIYRKGNNIGYN